VATLCRKVTLDDTIVLSSDLTVSTALINSTINMMQEGQLLMLADMFTGVNIYRPSRSYNL
jgi:hypothetical protein